VIQIDRSGNKSFGLDLLKRFPIAIRLYVSDEKQQQLFGTDDN